MVQYKTVAVPHPMLKGVKSNDIYTVNTANMALSPVAQAIQNEARGGWALHSVTDFGAVIKRKKGILEILLGWIPFIGPLFFVPKNSAPYYDFTYTTLVFFKED